MTSFRPQYNRGLSLIEILVSVAIFSIVMIVSIGSLVSINDSNKKAQLTRTVMDNLNFAMEDMARNLRVGTVYHCDSDHNPAISSPYDCLNGASSISFMGYKGNRITYRLDGNTHQITQALDIAPALSITSPELTIESLTFYVTGTAAGDGKQPRAVMVITGSAFFKQGIQSHFKIQTSVSQRRLDS